jgi:hypothetical protein
MNWLMLEMKVLSILMKAIADSDLANSDLADS